MVKSCLTWFGNVWRRSIKVSVRRVDQMDDSSVVRGRGRPRQTIGQINKRDLEINCLFLDLKHDRAL